MTQAKILPTVGRVVWFFDKKRRPGFHQNTDGAPYAAIIAAVCTEDVVNLTVSDASGTPHGRVGVPLSHEGGQPIGADYWCEWMPYQKGQAAKTEAVERSLGNLSKHLGLVQLPVVDPGAGSIERQIQAQGPAAPRVTPADIEANIASEHYCTAADGFRFNWLTEDHKDAETRDSAHRIAGSISMRSHAGTSIDIDANAGTPQALCLLTFCVLVLRNGTKVVGINYGAIDPAQHSAEKGRAEARKEAVGKVYELLGFRLRDQLHERAQFSTGPQTGEQINARITTFDDLVRHGLAQCMAEGREDNIYNGMPWSFNFKGRPVTHENDNCYLVGPVRFERGNVLLIDPSGDMKVVPEAGVCSTSDMMQAIGETQVSTVSRTVER